jgi:transcription elongation factor GreA
MATSERLPMLAEGYEKLTAELKALREERPKIVEAIEEARAHGDLSENAEYHSAKERQGQIEAAIGDLEDRVSRAQIIDPTTLSGDRIVFGATVTLLDDGDKPVRYQIVGQTEADAKVGRISYNSPLGRALIGRRKGDEIEVTVPSGDRFYVVKKIEFV